MLKVKSRKKDVLISMPKKLVKSGFVQNFLDRLDSEIIAQSSKFSYSDAWNLSEELKKSWWSKNKSSVISRIND